MENIKIAYLGGGSKQWARTFMTDLALSDGLTGEIGLYDIDREAALRNQKIGNRINQNPATHSKFEYVVYDTLEATLKDATFVVISILPGTFEEMRSDVHAPEAYGIYQSVGDTAGPGGVLRAMRTVPIYEEFARKIQQICPKAWVINFTNPMSICVKTLYDVFPDIKAFGCCHEVFHTQAFLCLVLEKEKNIKATRKDIYTDACGVNHFTWMTEARYKDIDLLSLLPRFMNKYYADGYYEYGDRFAFRKDCFAYGNKVKMNLFARYGALAAAGDRHLVEFVNPHWYLKDPECVKRWKYNLTTVDFRVAQMEERIEESILLAEGKKEFELMPSGEEATDLMKAILGHKQVISNVNLPNTGQCPQLPMGSIIETNCIFTNNQVKPVVSKPLPLAVLHMVYKAANNIDTLYEGIKQRDFEKIFACFMNQALCSTLTLEEGRSLFKEMIKNTRTYLEDFYPTLDEFLKD